MDMSFPTVLYTTAAPASGALVASGHVVLYSLRAQNGNAARRYVQLFDAAGVPPDGSVPLMILGLEGSADKEWHCQGTPRFFRTGLVWAFSSTNNVHTLAAPECWLEAQYVMLG